MDCSYSPHRGDNHVIKECIHQHLVVNRPQKVSDSCKCIKYSLCKEYGLDIRYLLGRYLGIFGLAQCLLK